MTTLGTKLYRFYSQLRIDVPLPEGIAVLEPYRDAEVLKAVRSFFRKFYHDNQPRRLLIGINPGRFGAGITGINFTAPRQLREHCGIEHPFGNSSELSAEFIYDMIGQYGGAEKFYRHYFIAALSPLGYTREGKNLNYYDSRELQDAVKPFISDCLDTELSFGFDTRRCFCIGGEKNFKFLSTLNEERKEQGLVHFRQVVPLPHPRFIMQYRRKKKQEFIDLYLRELRRP